VHVKRAPTAVPTTGVEHVPSVTVVAEPQSIGGSAKRTTYRAGCPSPSSTSVNESVAEFWVTASTARSVTVPGKPGRPPPGTANEEGRASGVSRREQAATTRRAVAKSKSAVRRE